MIGKGMADIGILISATRGGARGRVKYPADDDEAERDSPLDSSPAALFLPPADFISPAKSSVSSRQITAEVSPVAGGRSRTLSEERAASLELDRGVDWPACSLSDSCVPGILFLFFPTPTEEDDPRPAPLPFPAKVPSVAL